MFDPRELPDFDSMSQEELMAWLAQLRASRNDSRNGDEMRATNGGAPDWLDDTQPAMRMPPPADDDTPTDAALDETHVNLPPDAIDWLREIAEAEAPEELPDITDYRPPEPGVSLSDILAAAPEDDALTWLDDLSGEMGNAASAAHGNHPTADNGADYDESYEDDETLDDLDDESLYSPRGQRSNALMAALLGMRDHEAHNEATESLAPLSEPPEPEPQADNEPQADRLSQAFAPGMDSAELESWYAERLAAIDGNAGNAPAHSAPPHKEESPAQDSPPAPDADSKPPPPGLAAVINSAREKAAANALPEALDMYETLLLKTAGLEWVKLDMQALAQHPVHAANHEVHRLLGDALFRLDELDGALAAYRKALSLL